MNLDNVGCYNCTTSVPKKVGHFVGISNLLNLLVPEALDTKP